MTGTEWDDSGTLSAIIIWNTISDRRTVIPVTVQTLRQAYCLRFSEQPLRIFTRNFTHPLPVRHTCSQTALDRPLFYCWDSTDFFPRRHLVADLINSPKEKKPFNKVAPFLSHLVANVWGAKMQFACQSSSNSHCACLCLCRRKTLSNAFLALEQTINGWKLA